MNIKLLSKVGDAIKKIPWGDVKTHGPVIVAAGKAIYDRVFRNNDGISIEQRVEIIEETEKDQQKYISQLADLITNNSDYIYRLSMRINILFILVLILIVLLMLK
ncbi:MAG: hypothetical protein HOK94_00895 [Candidatus Marinimicrobia bacterium]|jgi:hypothetical protein|nr:hypothetical protein [Candidatus Neomarinimicrobiota bacterium]MBT4733472.1 hypothetical protein [Candidatus Neomarinimicrobiota bacterium]MBT5460187.1 hypothetical protein [Candidatus Neomarinimicrobiota bacterium]MBT5759194.1 hypothetical protein [Candidatus Neomarinimicrobiota bacterium]